MHLFDHAHLIIQEFPPHPAKILDIVFCACAVIGRIFENSLQCTLQCTVHTYLYLDNWLDNLHCWSLTYPVILAAKEVLWTLSWLNSEWMSIYSVRTVSLSVWANMKLGTKVRIIMSVSFCILCRTRTRSCYNRNRHKKEGSCRGMVRKWRNEREGNRHWYDLCP